MRKMLCFLIIVALATRAATAADDSKDQVAKPDAVKKKETDTAETKAKLKVGDAAPALKVSKWLQGKEVSSFAPGKVYVIEFWATWCGPCIVMMPHMGELQSEYKDKGLTIIGFSAKDANNGEDKVTGFVAKRGPKLGYTFAYGDDRQTYDAWMTAAEQHGIPCCFVVDRNGKIAYIGHPMYLGEVLPKVIGGTWKTEEGAKELAEIEKDVNSIFRQLGGSDTGASLKALQELEAKRPALGTIPYFIGPKLSLLIKSGKIDEAKKMADTVIAKATAQDDSGCLSSVARALGVDGKDVDGGIRARSLQAVDALLKISGDKDLSALLTAAEVYFATGDQEKAKKFAKQAIEVAPEHLRPRVERFVKKFIGEAEGAEKTEKTDGKKAEKK